LNNVGDAARTLRRLGKITSVALSLVVVAIALVNALVPNLGILRRYTVSSSSMEPTLHCANTVGCKKLKPDHILASKVPYLYGDPKRGDIVVVKLSSRHRACDGSLVVKRIVGVPGDEVIHDHMNVIINGYNETGAYTTRSDVVRDKAKVKRLGANHYLVLGDNRRQSCDSREYGEIERQEIQGKMITKVP
jgi:signal peptidase I